MSKAILILSMPDRCISCPCFHCDDMKDWCGVTNDYIKDGFKILESCPLKPVPEKHPECEVNDYWVGFDSGYNACVDKIVGE